MPSSIQLEIVIGGAYNETLVDVLDLEVPGSHVKALSSAATLVKEMQFSKRVFEHKKITKKSVVSKTELTEELKLAAAKKQQEDDVKAE